MEYTPLQVQVDATVFMQTKDWLTNKNQIIHQSQFIVTYSLNKVINNLMSWE